MGMTTEPTYRGIPLSRLIITAVVWTDDAADHIRTRTVRYADTEVNLEPAWATEAALDPHRMLFVPNTGTSLGVIGWSVTGRLVLKIWLQPIDMTAGEWAGASAAKANASITNRYRRNQ
jgi:hypothetical protein